MTRRKDRKILRDSSAFRALRIQKLLDRGWISSADQIPAEAIPVDPDRVNLGGSWHQPIFYEDISFRCRDCGVSGVWKAEKQRLYFELTGAPYYELPVRCRPCRIVEKARKDDARRRAGHEPEA